MLGVALAPSAALPQTTEATAIEPAAGEPANIKDHPWQVAVDVRGRLCGGSLIADRWVLTAASCLEEARQPLDVKLKADADDVNAIGLLAHAEKFIKHERFRTVLEGDDLAMVKLRKAIGGKPVPLVTDYTIIAPGQVLEATGWEHARDRSSPAPLRNASMQVVPNDLCSGAQAPGGALAATMICTGHKDGAIASCHGDLGGPLILRKWSGPVLIGVMSFPNACAEKKRHGIYTRVVHYRSWISAVMNTNKE